MREEIKTFARSGDENAIFTVEMAGRSYCDKSYHIYRHNSPITVIEYVEEGTGVVFENGRMHIASAGCVYLLHAGREHEYYSSAKDPWVKKWCNLSGVLPMQLLDSYGLGNTVVIQNCGAEVSALFDCFLDLCSSGQPNEQIFSECALCFHKIIMQLAARSRESLNRDMELAQEARRRIDASIETELSIDALCAELGTSRSKLFTCFRDAYGVAPYEYFQKVRLEAIKRLLKHTFLPISEISEQFHFADAHYFSGWFKKNEGLSPTQYRKVKMGK